MIYFNPFQAFAVIGTLSFLRVIVSFIPFATKSFGEAKVSFARMKVSCTKYRRILGKDNQV